MSWIGVGTIGLTALQGVMAGGAKKASIEANNTIREANAYASNLVRSANNEVSAAKQSLARFNQSVNNQRVLENASSNAEAALVNYRRTRDSVTNDDFEGQLRFAEQAGAQAAAGAFSGLTGGVVDIVNGTTALRKMRLQQRAKEQTKQMDVDAASRQHQIMQAGWDSLDYSEVDTSLDYSNNVAVQERYGGNFFTEVMGGQDPKNLANIFSKGKGFFKTASPSESLQISDTPQLGDSSYAQG